MEYRLLGPVEVRDRERSVPLSGGKQRAVLALLLLNANRVVSRERLIDELWGDEPPESAVTALQVYVSRLRKLLPAKALQTRSRGYVLEVEPEQVDLLRFERLIADARQAEPEPAARSLREALALWRGPALAEFDEPFARVEGSRLEDLRLAALEDRIDADLALARHAELVGELRALVAEHPHRERLRQQLLLALYRSGLQAEALEAYRDARATLDELGLEPGEQLRALERAILIQDPALAAPSRARTALPERPTPFIGDTPEIADVQGRKTVSILFCDVVDSTPLGEQLDPESLQRVMSRWFAEARAIVERHGGTVEKFIGDEVMAVFGVPVVHEDDALRAVRSASAMRERLGTLNDELEAAFGVRLAVRIGVNTGEVVVGDPSSGGTFVTGEPVNLAKRLEQAADPGQILIGKETYPLVENAVRAGPLESFRVKGKRDAVAPYRVEHVDAGAPGVARRRDTPLVGRTTELGRLEQAFATATAGPTSRLVTVVGAAGLGKTRLTEELVLRVAQRARVLTGRCLPYGDGITFWPLIEVLRSLGDVDVDAVLAGLEDGDAVAERLRALTSETPGPVDELFWAARRLLEALGAERPLVLVLEDLDRAEPTFLDLVEYLHSRIEGAPVLLVCPARPELLEKRPEWTAPNPRADVVVLEPLSAEHAQALLAGLGVDLDDATRERVLRSAEGNPLYVEQLAALAGGGDVVVPPTIQALLAERLDRLDGDERAILERAAVVGQEFSRQIVTDLCPPERRGGVGRHLLALVRKELIRPYASPSSRDDSFRFRHALIRDVAYEAMPKEARALFHEWCADWIERNAGDRALELEEIAGYHLEQSVGLRAELGPRDARTERLARRAAALLGAAGLRAQARGDVPAAIGLLERTAALLDSDDPGAVAVAVELGTALHAGGQFDRADLVLTEAEAAAGRLGDDRLLAHAELEHAFVRMYYEPERALPRLEAVAQEAVGVFTRFDDDAGLARAWRVVAGGQFGRGRFAEAAATLDRAIVHANRAGVEREEAVLLWRLSIALALGPVPAAEALARMGTILPRVGHTMVGEGVLRALIARMHGMLGHDAEAREEYARARYAVERLGDSVYAAALALYAGPVEQFAGDLAGAERELRAAVERLGAMGEKGAFSTVAVLLARVRLELGDVDEAAALVEASEDAAAAEDVYSRTLSRGARARILAVRGDPVAMTLARETVALAHETDGLSLQGTALLDLALVLDGEGAEEALGAACERFAAKGDLASLARARLDSGFTKA